MAGVHAVSVAGGADTPYRSTIAVPNGAQAGQVFAVCHIVDNDAALAGMTPVGGGFVQRAEYGPLYEPRLKVWTRTLTAGDLGTTFTFQHHTSSGNRSLAMVGLACTEVDPDAPLDVGPTTGYGTGSQTTMQVPALTPSIPGGLSIVLGAGTAYSTSHTGNQFFTTPAAWTERYDVGQLWLKPIVYTRDNVTGSTGSANASITGGGAAAGYSSMHVVLRHKPSGPVVIDIAVRGARAATNTTRPLLTQNHPLDVRSARSPSQATRPLLAQAAPLAIRAVQSATRAATTLLAQSTPIAIQPARSATRATRPDLTQQHPPLVVTDIRTATRASAPTLAQHHTLVVRAARAATTAATPLLTHAVTLLIDGARSGTHATTALLTQSTPLSVNDARAQTRATRPLLTSGAQMVISGARSATRAGRALLAQHNPLVVRDARSSTTADRPLLTQRHQLAIRGARSVTRASRPLLKWGDQLLIRGARAATRATRPLLTQTIDLVVRGARTATRATRVLLVGPVGEPVPTPTRISVEEHRGHAPTREPRGVVEPAPHLGAVAVQERHGDALVDVPGPVMVHALQGKATVTVHRRGLVELHERFGTVLDMT